VTAAITVGLAGCAAPARQTPPPATGAVQATGADDDHTVTLHVGQRLTVRLNSTYWTFTQASARLRADGTPVVTATRPCRPAGMGCGAVTMTYDAVAAGGATVTAHRTSCGEALRCTGSDGTYRLDVVIR
jgi:hypothetical protein